MDEKCYVEPVQKNSTPEERQGITTARLAVSGMGCPNCANRVRNSLVTLNGVVDADVDHSAGLALVDYSPGLVSMQSLLNAVAQAGGDGRHNYTAMFIEELSP